MTNKSTIGWTMEIFRKRLSNEMHDKDKTALFKEPKERDNHLPTGRLSQRLKSEMDATEMPQMIRQKRRVTWFALNQQEFAALESS